MSVLKNGSFKKYTLFDQSSVFGTGQSEYVYNVESIWKAGTMANLNLIARNEDAFRDAEKVLKKALFYDVTEVTLFLSRQLSRYYPHRGTKSDINRIQKIVSDTQAQFNIEAQLEVYLSNVDIDSRHKLSNQKILSKLEEYLQEIDKVIHEFDSLSFLLNAYTLKMRKAQFLNDKSEIMKIGNEAMARLEAKPYSLPNVVYLLFEFPLVCIYIQNKEYDKAERIIENLYDRLNQKSVNWYAVHSMDILLNFRRLNFEKVKVLLEQVKRHENDVNRERNKMYAAYVSLFTERSFPLGKFKDELYEHRKDRQGHRVNIIIVHLLHMLKYKRYGQFIDKVEGIKKYMQRYLKSKNKNMIRSRYFLECLMMAAHNRVNFEKIPFQRWTDELYNKLKATPETETDQVLEQEIIDFEYLYFFVEGMSK